MMVHVDESFNFHTSRNSFDLISLPGLTLPTETNDSPENFKKKIIRVKASRPLVLYINDLPNCLMHSQPRMYADDTSITYASNDVEEIECCVNIDLDGIRI